MRISKTRFINYIRCNRHPALDEIYRDKDKAIVSFTDDPELEDLIGEENKQKISVLLDDMIDEEGEDLLIKQDTQMETMMPYYSQIEVISGQAIQNRFKGDVTYSLNTFDQKRFEHEYQGFRFYCFLDGYQEDKDTIRIFEVKATTSKKFIDLEYKNNHNEKTPLFEYSPEGILMLQEDLHGDVNDHYYEKVAKLRNRLGKEGRYVYDISYQRYVLEKAIQSKKDVKYYLVVLNSEYIHQGLVNDRNEPIYTDDIITIIDVTTLTESMIPVIENDVQTVIQRLDVMNANPVDLGPHCQRKDSRECKFYPICYGHIPEKNSIFSYIGGHHGFKDSDNNKYERFDLINERKVKATDIPYEWLNRKNNVIQRDVIESNQPYVHPQKIRAGIELLRYPIYHLDFETFPCPLPRFKGEKPYSQSLFQYSIHIEHEPGICDKDSDNYSYVATEHIDLRKDLVENMLKVIKQDGGSIMVYNKSFEQTRLKEMAEIYPEYKSRLFDMIDRLFDLMHLLKGNKKVYASLGFEGEDLETVNYYHNDLNGSYSIKKVLPVFSDLTYQGMGIANGTDALVTYARFPMMDKKTFETSYQDLLEYCKQDTWAMVKILEELRKF
ncbi:DUF2779 domain-containing protein [Peloplasma aerotolerans]|uniref:DUF2779 domain-containing protein n=1 Tax=Peloplasma aerotolerans TaxID=3044389 RepID=A0AAW6U738_9MOLU|nr:DUF2779 domain-containing protein [Mariniplasma sp. M4Ah]MDI6453773.1 DUF2779 domain-containing protein [Mariniplasma sp. M4Ah]